MRITLHGAHVQFMYLKAQFRITLYGADVQFIYFRAQLRMTLYGADIQLKYIKAQLHITFYGATDGGPPIFNFQNLKLQFFRSRIFRFSDVLLPKESLHTTLPRAVSRLTHLNVQLFGFLALFPLHLDDSRRRNFAIFHRARCRRDDQLSKNRSQLGRFWAPNPISNSNRPNRIGSLGFTIPLPGT